MNVDDFETVEEERDRLRESLVKVEDELLRLKLIAAGLYAAREELPEWAQLRVVAMVSAPSPAWTSESEGDPK
jgi:hypothetical protein